MSSFVVHMAGDPPDLPNWAGLTRADIHKLNFIQRKELNKSYDRNKLSAKRERIQLASCRDASFVQKLDPRYVTNCCFNYIIYIAFSQHYLTSNFCTVSYRSVCSEQQYIAVYFDTIGIDGRYLVNWQLFAQDILEDSKSSRAEQFWAKVLLDAFDYACYIPADYAEWHHLTPLCMFGSVDDPQNYIRLPPGWHLKVHFALCFFFPSHLPLAYSVKCMMDKGKKTMKSKISPEEFWKYMNDIEFISTAFAKALSLIHI